jgi:uncharacterized protein (DUF3820 family)
MGCELKMPFGKHKGASLKDIPGDYLRWLSTIELREPLRGAVMAALNLTVQIPTAAPRAPQPAPRPKPKPSAGRFWPESEDLSAYYSRGENDGIPY